MKNILKNLILILLLGVMYVGIEILWRGYSNIAMIFVGGYAGFCIGMQNESKRKNRSMWVQCLLATLETLYIEFVSGEILNVGLKLNIWDYSNLPFNLDGQVCLLYAVLWFFLMPTAIYADDFLRYKLFHEEKPKSLINNYIDLFLLR